MTEPAVERPGKGTWTKLRQRKVVQWGIAYAAAAWGFLQVLEYLSETYGWPPQLRKVAVLALLVGLPIVLVVAWYHGDRGDQRVGRTELAILILLVALGGGVLWRYQPANDINVPVRPFGIDAAGQTCGCGSTPLHRSPAIRESQRGPG